MEKNLDLKLGTIVQINPDLCDTYGGQFCIVTEVKEFGIQGYLATVLPYEGLTRFKGVAYCRFTWEKIEVVGKVEWKIKTVNQETGEKLLK